MDKKQVLKRQSRNSLLRTCFICLHSAVFGKIRSGLLHIVGDLRLEGVEGGELALLPEEIGRAHV